MYAYNIIRNAKIEVLIYFLKKMKNIMNSYFYYNISCIFKHFTFVLRTMLHHFNSIASSVLPLVFYDIGALKALGLCFPDS